MKFFRLNAGCSMNKQQKEVIVSALRDNFSHSAALYLIGFRGATVEQLYNLRKVLRKNNGSLKVAKVRLVKRAIEGIPGIDELLPLLKDQVALVFAEQESPAVAKVIYDFVNGNEKVTVVAGFFASKVLSPDSVKRIACLPPREVLLAQVCGTIKAPIAKCVTIFNMMPMQLLMVLKQIEEKKKNS
jgi:large subunit ribosomal protein L10